MVIITNDSLILTIQDSDPVERLKWIRKACIAAVRWRAQCENNQVYGIDGENLHVIAQLCEALLEDG